MARQKTQAREQVVQEQVVDLRDAFVELIGERWGYYAGRTLKVQEMNEKTEAERKAANEARKSLSKTGTDYIGLVPCEDNLSKMSELHASMQTQKATVEEKAKALKEARSPFQKPISLLAKAIKYCDNVAIPDSLKELGHPVTPRFSLSDWIAEATKPKKK